MAAANFTIGVPNTLPSGGYAQVSSGVTARTFLATSSIAKLDAAALRRAGPRRRCSPSTRGSLRTRRRSRRAGSEGLSPDGRPDPMDLSGRHAHVTLPLGVWAEGRAVPRTPLRDAPQATRQSSSRSTALSSLWRGIWWPPVTDSLTHALAHRVRTAQAEQRIPGVAALVSRDGEAVFSDAVGVAEIAGGTPVTADTQFRIGSITKTFTAAAIMQLRDAGALRLDDALSDHLSDTPHSGLRLRDLLSHLSGLQREFPGDVWDLRGHAGSGRAPGHARRRRGGARAAHRVPLLEPGVRPARRGRRRGLRHRLRAVREGAAVGPARAAGGRPGLPSRRPPRATSSVPTTTGRAGARARPRRRPRRGPALEHGRRPGRLGRLPRRRAPGRPVRARRRRHAPPADDARPGALVARLRPRAVPVPPRRPGLRGPRRRDAGVPRGPDRAPGRTARRGRPDQRQLGRRSPRRSASSS